MKVNIFQFLGHGVKAREKLAQILKFKIPSIEYDTYSISNLEIKDYPEVPQSMQKMCGQVLPSFNGEFIKVRFELKVSSKYDAWYKFGEGAFVKIPVTIA